MDFEGARISEEVAKYARAVINHFSDKFDFLEEARIAYLVTDEDLKVRGRCCAACVFFPDAQGQNRRIYHWALTEIFGHLPQVIMLVQEECWQDFDDTARIALIYHELRHLRQKETNKGPSFDDEGLPVLQMIDHDIGEFDDVARLFGEWEPGLTHFRRELDNNEARVDVGPIIELINNTKTEGKACEG